MITSIDFSLNFKDGTSPEEIKAVKMSIDNFIKHLTAIVNNKSTVISFPSDLSELAYNSSGLKPAPEFGSNAYIAVNPKSKLSIPTLRSRIDDVWEW